MNLCTSSTERADTGAVPKKRGYPALPPPAQIELPKRGYRFFFWLFSSYTQRAEFHGFQSGHDALVEHLSDARSQLLGVVTHEAALKRHVSRRTLNVVFKPEPPFDE